MDLLKYLEPMKNMPERFSNLAFWRGVRKLKDEVVNAFEYIDIWGKSIESEIESITPPTKMRYVATNENMSGNFPRETISHVIDTTIDHVASGQKCEIITGLVSGISFSKILSTPKIPENHEFTVLGGYYVVNVTFEDDSRQSYYLEAFYNISYDKSTNTCTCNLFSPNFQISISPKLGTVKTAQCTFICTIGYLYP